MEQPWTSLGNLSLGAHLLLDYLMRHWKQRRAQLPREFLERSLQGAYPLFRYFLPAGKVLKGAIEELDRAGCLRGEPPALDPAGIERVQRTVKEYIRLECRDIVKRIPLANICQIVESESDDENVKWLIERLKFLRVSDLREAARFSSKYSKALLEIGVEAEGERRGLMALLAELVGMKAVEAAPVKNGCDVPVCLYQASDFVPNSVFRMAMAVLKCEGDPEEQFQAAVRVAEADRVDPLAFLMIGRSGAVAQRMSAFPERRRTILLGEGELKRIGLSPHPQQCMRECVFPQLPPSAISPFRFKGPVTGDSFFGRSAEIRRIEYTPSVSYTIFGARRIGKTSLLKTLRNECSAAPGPEGRIAVFVDGVSSRQLSWFQRNLMQEILRETEQAGVEFDWIEPGKGFFNDLSAALKNSGRKYLFLLDEVDYLVLDPEIGLLEEFVRNMSNMGYAQFVFSGYRILRSRTEDRSSFFHNLFQSMPLGPLNKREAEELVRTQMDRILVRFENQQVVEEILNLGSTFASTLQFMCDLLLKRLDEPDHDRCVTAADVRAVYDSAEFSKEITSAALESGEQGMGPLERLILCWAAACEFEQFTKKDLMEWLGRTVHFPKLSEVGGALNYLAATYLLAEVQGKYYFYMPHLREKLRAPEYDIEYVLNYLMREYRERQEWLRAAESAR